MKALFIFTAFFVLTFAASARIGESRAQLIARYGKPIQESAGSLHFEKSGFTVSATLLNGTCQFLMISSPVKEGDSAPKAFSPEKLVAFLEANGGFGNWIDTSPIFKTKDGNLTATLLEPGTLLIMTKAYKEKGDAEIAERARKANAEKAGVSGF